MQHISSSSTYTIFKQYIVYQEILEEILSQRMTQLFFAHNTSEWELKLHPIHSLTCSPLIVFRQFLIQIRIFILLFLYTSLKIT